MPFPGRTSDPHNRGRSHLALTFCQPCDSALLAPHARACAQPRMSWRCVAARNVVSGGVPSCPVRVVCPNPDAGWQRVVATANPTRVPRRRRLTVENTARALPRTGRRRHYAGGDETMAMSRRSMLKGIAAAGTTVVVAGTGVLSYRVYDQAVLDPNHGRAFDPWRHWEDTDRRLGLVARPSWRRIRTTASHGCSASTRPTSMCTPTAPAGRGRLTRSVGKCTSGWAAPWRTS